VDKVVRFFAVAVQMMGNYDDERTFIESEIQKTKKN